MPDAFHRRLQPVPILFAAGVALAAAPAPSLSQSAFVEKRLAPGVRHDPSVPTLEEVVGHDFHEAVTPPAGIVRYLRALHQAAPGRTHLVEYARTWEGRPLVMLVIGTPERIADLEGLKAELRSLAHPDGLSTSDRTALVDRLPAVVALVHSVHGNEVSGGGAAMAEAYHLLAARDDARVDRILESTLVLIDPSQNPDGRGRFVQHFGQSRALPTPDPDAASAAHDEPWPGGRTNHYLFDLNRDWFAQTQPESRGRVAALLEYQPHVVADLHEMGGNATYYFPPAAVPGNPWTTAPQAAGIERIGRGIADVFDGRGFRYFTRELYDSYYPGYGASWPTTQGALGMTFEQASARGLVYRRDDGSLLTYGDGVLHHALAALATLDVAARDRERLLRDFLAFRADRPTGPAAYVLHSAHDAPMLRRLAHLLAANGVEVRIPTSDLAVEGRTLRAGHAAVVRLDQPTHRLVRNLLDPTTPMDPDFVQRQIELRSQRRPDEIYDITAWSLPLLWDVEAIAADRVPEVAAPPVPSDLGATPSTYHRPVGRTQVPSPARVGWLVPWNSAGVALVAEALRTDVTVRALGGATTWNGREFGIGTAFFPVGDDPDDLRERLGAMASRHGAEVVPLDSGFKDGGVSLGSNRTRALELPRVMLVWGEPAQSYSAGWARFVLEQRYGIPVTAVRGDRAGRVRLDDYDVVVLPEGGYSSAWPGEEGIDDLRDWMRAGGTLVTMGESSRWAARVGLLATSTELRGGAPEFGGVGGGRAEAPPEQPVDPIESIVPERELPEPTPGAILNVDLDPEHWLASGTDGRIGAMVDGPRVFSPIRLDDGTNVGRYAGLDDLVAGGIVWEEARPQLVHKAWLVHQPEGGGELVAFAEDPNYRAYAEASMLIFANAVLLGGGAR
jgi:hypothetical protein